MYEGISRRWEQLTKKHRSFLQDLKTMGLMFKRSYLSVAGAVIIAVLIFIAVFASYIAPNDPYTLQTELRLQPPSSRLGPIILTIICTVVFALANARDG